MEEQVMIARIQRVIRDALYGIREQGISEEAAMKQLRLNIQTITDEHLDDVYKLVDRDR